MRKTLSFLLPLLFALPPSTAQNKDLLIGAFEAAGAEFGVPADILKAVAFAETRWSHMTWADGDTASCMGMPRPYGVTALWDNEVFGHSLDSAAALLGVSKEVLKNDFVQNIRGAAALMRRAYDRQKGSFKVLDQTDLTAWSTAIEAHSGIRQPELAASHAYEVLYRLTKGHKTEGIDVPMRVMDLSRVRTRLRTLEESRHAEADMMKSSGAAADSADYPEARWVPGRAGYYYPPEAGYGKHLVVIHDMEGYYASVLSYFQTLSDGRQVSIHYCVNGLQDSPSDYPPGDVAQMVRNENYGWHAVCLNRYSFGIEHEGFSLNPAWFTPEMYVASAKLVKYMCDTYGIPMDRNHIVGHNSYQNGAWVNWAYANLSPAQPWGTCNNHTDPGPNWDWDFLMQLITRDSTAPRVTSVPPAAPIQIDDRVSVTFSQRMDPAITGAAVRISPSIAVNLSWADNGRTLRIQPASLLPFDTEYTVTIDSSSRNYIGVGLDQDDDAIYTDKYEFTFRSVVQDVTQPSVLTTYPSEGQTQISRSAEFIVNFNERLDQTSLAGSFSLQTAGGLPFTVTGITYTSGTSSSRVRFKTTSELFPNTDYVVTVSTGVKDLSGNPLSSERVVTFSTEPITTAQGTVLLTLDATGSWWQPSTSGSTMNVLATFAISTTTKKSGTGSGKVEYTFTQSSNGIIREHNTSTPSIEGGPMVGAWVFGDNSGHDLRFAFYYTSASGTNSFATVSAGTINWTGWKFKTVPVSSIPVGNGSPRRFASFMVYQVAGGEQSGTIYFDDVMIVSGVTDVEDMGGSEVPADFRLLQNYPNPFNPTTTVAYDIPFTSHVRLTVWNALGQRVAVVADVVRAPGRYSERFDGSGLTSGVYFVQLEAGERVMRGKMVLLK